MSKEDMINTVQVVMNYLYKDVGDTWYGDLLSDVLEELMNNSDAVPVVRCKDCIHLGQCTTEIVMSRNVGSYIYFPMGNDGFCSWGVRKKR